MTQRTIPSQKVRSSTYNTHTRVLSISNILPVNSPKDIKDKPMEEACKVVTAKQDLNYIRSELAKIEKNPMTFDEIQEKTELSLEYMENQALHDLLAMTAQRFKELNMQHTQHKRQIAGMQKKVHRQKVEHKRQESLIKSDIGTNLSNGRASISSEGSIGSDELPVNGSFISRANTEIPEGTNNRNVETPR